MTTKDRQVSIMRKELSKQGKQGVAAAKAGVCRQTAAKYQRPGKRPSELKQVRDWRTQADGFADVWLPMASSTTSVEPSARRR